MTRKQQIPINFSEIGKIPPQALEFEEAVLGAIMLSKNSLLEIPFIKPICFYKDSHQKIFTAIIELSNDNKPIDILTVTEKLKVNNVLDEIGGGYYISSLTSRIASSSNIEYHARIVFQKFIQREFIRISNDTSTMAYDESIDIQDLIDFANKGIDEILGGIYVQSDITWYENIKDSLLKYDERYKNYKEGRYTGIATPICKLTKYTSGWQPQNLIVIAARPSMGKTAFAIECMTSATKMGFKPVYFSIEMETRKITDRIIIGESGIDADKYRNGNLNEYEYKQLNNAITKIEKWNQTIDDSIFTFNDIRNKSRILKKKNKCDLIIIDYLQLLKYMGKAGNREQEVAETSRGLKLLAKELNVPIIVLSQLNREVEKRPEKRPILADLRESGAIEQDADVVIFIHRPYHYGDLTYEDGTSTLNMGEIIIAKQRDGQTGMIQFKHNQSLTKIFDYDEISIEYSKQYDPDSRISPNNNFEKEYDPF